VILVVDNYDSFTYNLVQMLLVEGREVEVVRNDVDSAAALLARAPEAIVLSPGPGRPEEAGVCSALVEAGNGMPILGVCLGHQVLGQVHGAVIERAPRLLHGKTSSVRHDGRGLFAGLPDPFEATRYHSLAVRPESLPPELETQAWSDDGVLMGMRHRHQPWWGVQFHPESVLTREGPALMRNFLRLAREARP
jgi:anthranilate synthase component 2